MHYFLYILHMEEWKDIVGYEGLYQISNKGNIRQCPRELKTSTDAQGYKVIQLRDDDGKKKVFKIHRLVANAFCNNENVDTQNFIVHHKDHNKQNNSSDNLMFMDRKSHTEQHKLKAI